MADSFNTVQFVMTLSVGLSVPMIPKWPDRNEPTRAGSIVTAIDGTPSLQEITRAWKPMTLVFGQQNHPAALITEAMHAAFLASQESGGTHTLSLEGTSYTVMWDWERSGGNPFQRTEVTPTGIPTAERLYEGTLFFRRKV